jgi:membrane protein YqaA with SNARE-associated domain
MVQEFFLQLSGLGYFGIFLISLIGSSTIIFPLPASTFVFLAAAALNPLLLGIVAGMGAALGELVGYVFGRAGRKIGQKKFEKELDKARRMFEKYGGFLALIVFAATPLPDDVAGIVAGLLKYDVKRFFVAVSIGKIIFHLVLAYGGYYGINWILNL